MTTQEYLAKRGAIQVLDSAELFLYLQHGRECAYPVCASCDALLEIDTARAELVQEIKEGGVK